jgi:hypothetical protein
MFAKLLPRCSDSWRMPFAASYWHLFQSFMREELKGLKIVLLCFIDCHNLVEEELVLQLDNGTSKKIVVGVEPRQLELAVSFKPDSAKNRRSKKIII